MSDSQAIDGDALPPFAATWLAQRRLAYERLERMRLEELRLMTQADRARVFAQLDPPHPYVLRPSSGLIQQQRLFSRLHRGTGPAESEP